MTDTPEKQISPMPVSYKKFASIVSDLQSKVCDAYIETDAEGKSIVLMAEDRMLFRAEITEAALQKLRGYL